MVSWGESRHTPRTDVALLAVAVLLMLGGAAMLIADVVSAGITIPLIAIGTALMVVVVQNKRRRQHVHAD